MGISAISPSSESTFLPDKVLEQLKKRFKRIIILFDRDEAGVKMCIRDRSRISKVRIELLRLLICVEPTILAKVQSWDGSTKVTPVSYTHLHAPRRKL